MPAIRKCGDICRRSPGPIVQCGQTPIQAGALAFRPSCTERRPREQVHGMQKCSSIPAKRTPSFHATEALFNARATMWNVESIILMIYIIQLFGCVKRKMTVPDSVSHLPLFSRSNIPENQTRRHHEARIYRPLPGWRQRVDDQGPRRLPEPVHQGGCGPEAQRQPLRAPGDVWSAAEGWQDPAGRLHCQPQRAAEVAKGVSYTSFASELR